MLNARVGAFTVYLLESVIFGTEERCLLSTVQHSQSNVAVVTSAKGTNVFDLRQ